MKTYVITIESMLESVQTANRCIKSGLPFGLTIEKHRATTPADDPERIMEKLGILNTVQFNEIYSRRLNCMSAFLSHYSLWEKSVETNEDILILEHDAIIKGHVPDIPFKGCISYGAPSYGRYNIPMTLGVGPLVSKPYFPGAHAYKISPWGAKRLIKKAKLAAGPTDTFLNIENFPFLQEYYPWPIVAWDNFTTIQNPNGCFAKHNYGEAYEIL